MTRINILSVFIIIFACYSCQPNITKQNQEWILGEWVPIDYIYDISSFTGYLFEKEYCENKVGYYDYFYRTGPFLEYPYKITEEVIAEFCYTYNIYDDLYNVKSPRGYRTIYKIEKDSLLIFDLTNKIWIKHYIQFLSKDTMILSNRYSDKVRDRFVRKSYPIDNNQPLIDEFIFYYPPSCISNSKLYLIRRDGFFFSYGYFGANHFLIGQLQDDSFNRLDTLYKKADLSAILSRWDSLSVKGWEQPPRIAENVSFVINNQVTTIDRMPLRSFLGLSVESYWAYLAGLFLPDLAYIKPINESDYPRLLYEFDHFFDLKIRNHDEFLKLRVTEQFYLGMLLCYAKVVEDKTFTPKYTLTGFAEKNRTMQTDGRYFKYADRFNNEITLDIGFNFIEVNELEKNKEDLLMR